MSAIPQEWVDAALRGLHAHVILNDEDHVKVVLTAALPLIREAIARDIEERQHRDCTDYDCHWNDEHAGLGLAAEIIRGGVL